MKPKHPFSPYLLLLPTAVFLAVFFPVLLPLAAKNSFFTWDLLTPPRYVGPGTTRSSSGAAS